MMLNKIVPMKMFIFETGMTMKVTVFLTNTSQKDNNFNW